jgi:hypothetical protein
MRNSHFALIVAPLFAFFGMGCAKPYMIVRQATPDPFVGKTDFVVLPIDYSDLHVGEKTEADYVAGKKESSADMPKRSATT